MVLVADFFREGEEHVPVNASMLYIISNMYASEKILFYSFTSHISAIENFLRLKDLHVCNVSFKRVEHKNFFLAPSFYINRVLGELAYIISYNRKAGSEKPLIFFFLSLSPFTSLIFHKFYFKNKYRAIINLHGELEFIKLDKGRALNFLGKCYIQSFKMQHKKINYLVINENIKKKLVETGFVNEQKVLAITQPYVFKKIKLEQTEFCKKPLRIGMIGVASLEKNSHLIFELANKLKQSIQEGLVFFNVIGKNENIDYSLQNELVEFEGKDKLLAREDFEEKILEIDFSIFFYQDNMYEFTMSGAVLDAIDFEKPIIALENNLFKSLFNTFGSMGYLCNDLEEMYIVIKSLLEKKNDIEMYNLMKTGMRKYKEKVGLEVIGAALSEQVNSEWC